MAKDDTQRARAKGAQQSLLALPEVRGVSQPRPNGTVEGQA